MFLGFAIFLGLGLFGRNLPNADSLTQVCLGIWGVGLGTVIRKRSDDFKAMFRERIPAPEHHKGESVPFTAIGTLFAVVGFFFFASGVVQLAV